MKQVIKYFYSAYRQKYRLSPEQASACQSIRQCQTEALGGYIQSCHHCHYQQTHYCSCTNRHCPLCKQVATKDWLKKQQDNLLPVPYYHTVFTLPHEFNGWVRLHPQVMYNILFTSVWQTLKAFSMQHRKSKGQLGVTCVLHTWGQNLSQHVHLHCLIPGLTLSLDKQHVNQATKRRLNREGQYLYPIKALQRKYRGKLVSLVRQAYQAGELFRIKQPQQVKQILGEVMKKTWVIYIKPYLENPQTILQYLSRYTYKIAISNQRIISVNPQGVKFSYTDYADNDKRKVMQLDGVEFLRRFLQHVLPKGFMRIRHYGFLANSVRKKRLDVIRQLLGCFQSIDLKSKPETTHDYSPKVQILCPKCQQGYMAIILHFKKVKRRC